MPKVVRVSNDICVGTILGLGNPTVFLDGVQIAVVGDSIVPHPPCELPSPPHCSAVMVQGSSTFSIHGKKVCRVGDA